MDDMQQMRMQKGSTVGEEISFPKMTPVTSRIEKLLLKPGEAAEALAISPRKLWAMTASGEIPNVRFGRSVRYDPADLREWIDTQKGGRR